MRTATEEKTMINMRNISQFFGFLESWDGAYVVEKTQQQIFDGCMWGCLVMFAMVGWVTDLHWDVCNPIDWSSRLIG